MQLQQTSYLAFYFFFFSLFLLFLHWCSLLSNVMRGEKQLYSIFDTLDCTVYWHHKRRIEPLPESYNNVTSSNQNDSKSVYDHNYPINTESQLSSHTTPVTEATHSSPEGTNGCTCSGTITSVHTGQYCTNLCGKFKILNGFIHAYCQVCVVTL